MDREATNTKWMRRSTLCAILVAILFPGAIYLSRQVEIKTAEVAQWLPTASPERQQYDQFREFFGNDLFLVATWDGCDLDDPRAGEFKSRLLEAGEQTDPGLIQSVASSQEMVDDLVYGAPGLSLAAARKRLEGAFIGKEGQSLFWIQLGKDSKEANERILELAETVLNQDMQIPKDEIHFAGSAYHAIEIDRTSSESAKHLILPACAIAIFTAWLFIGRFKLALIVFGLAAVGEIFGMALVGITGGSLNAVTIVMPTLIFMLTTSAAVHLVNYYYEAKAEGKENPAIAAVRAGAPPCLLASITTVIGLSSLAISKLAPVREFGIYAGAALFIATLILISTFAYLVSLFSTTEDQKADGWRQSSRNMLGNVGSFFTNRIIKFANPLALLGIIAILIGALGVNRLDSSVDLKEMFPEDAKIVQDFHWIESEIAPLLSVEIIVGIPEKQVTDSIDRLRIVRGFENEIRKVQHVTSVTSAVTFLPPLPSRKNSIRNTSRKSMFRSALSKDQAALVENGLLAEKNGMEYWRVSANVAKIEENNHPIVEDIKDACLPFQDKLASKGVTLDYTGLSPVIFEAKNLLFRDLLLSFMLAFVLITPVMIWILRSVAGGLLVMIPNVAPVAIVFGIMGWLEVPVDIASILTASVALGIAIDDTLHFVTWFRKGQQQGMNRAAAVRFAYSKCALAMFQTTCIFCGALLVFLPTEFIPIRTFAVLMVSMLVGALVADLILLPALLAGRLGMFVKAKRKPRTVQPQSSLEPMKSGVL